MIPRPASPLAAVCAAAALAAVACHAVPPPAANPPVAASPAPPPSNFDPCVSSPPVPHPFRGILRVARCDQHMYLTMASVATQLGVECVHCHVQRKDDPTKEEYPVMTPRKEVANWMSMHLMQAIKTKDGSPLKCQSCHTDEHGAQVAKIFGTPRDPVKAMEWMNLVMVNRFVALDGSKLKCKSCHVGNFGTPGFQAEVIRRSAQIPAHAVGGKGPAL